MIYLANAGRPDMAVAVNNLARKCGKQTADDWTQVKRVFRYLKGTQELGLKYLGAVSGIEGYVDASSFG